jgi:SsrA-binding protein
MNKTPPAKKIVATNRKVRFNYHIMESFEAGIVLVGSEVKSIRNHQANIQEAYAGEMGGEIYLFNAYVPEYTQANRFNHEARRPRKLLLKKKQANKLIGQIKLKGYTVVALSLYFNEKNLLKVDLALAKGKTDYDKRDTKKEQDWLREKGRIVREHTKG